MRACIRWHFHSIPHLHSLRAFIVRNTQGGVSIIIIIIIIPFPHPPGLCVDNGRSPSLPTYLPLAKMFGDKNNIPPASPRVSPEQTDCMRASESLYPPVFQPPAPVLSALEPDDNVHQSPQQHTGGSAKKTKKQNQSSNGQINLLISDEH